MQILFWTGSGIKQNFCYWENAVSIKLFEKKGKKKKHDKLIDLHVNQL